MDTTEEIGSVAHADFPPLQHRELERTTSIETLSVKSEPMDNDEQSKRRVLAAQPTLSSSSSLSTKSFLISPPAQSHHHRSKTPTASNAHFPPMIANSNTAFAPRASSNLSQKTTWPAALSINAATRQPPITAQKRPAVPAPVYPPTAPRNSNATSSTMRMPVSTSLQPQSFDAFPINPTLQRRPNGVPLSSHTPPMSTRNPVRVSWMTKISCDPISDEYVNWTVDSRSDAFISHSFYPTSLGRVSLRLLLNIIPDSNLLPLFLQPSNSGWSSNNYQNLQR